MIITGWFNYRVQTARFFAIHALRTRAVFKRKVWRGCKLTASETEEIYALSVSRLRAVHDLEKKKPTVMQSILKRLN